MKTDGTRWWVWRMDVGWDPVPADCVWIVEELAEHYRRQGLIVEEGVRL